MDSNFKVLLISLSLMIVLTRSLPFFFANVLKGHQRLQLLERSMPSYILMLLVVYEIKPATLVIWPYGLPAILSLMILSLTQVLFRQIIITLLVGTLSFVVLLNLIL